MSYRCVATSEMRQPVVLVRSNSNQQQALGAVVNSHIPVLYHRAGTEPAVQKDFLNQ